MVRRLLWLNGLAILGVVLNHTVGWGFVALYWWADRYRAAAVVPSFDAIYSFDYWLLRVGEGLAICAIPAFLFVSGYFAAFALGRPAAASSARAVRSPAAIGVTAQVTPSAGAWGIVGSRIRGLLVPYLLWSVFYLALDAALGSIYSPASYAKRLAFGGAAPGFYYVPLLIQFYLLAPFLVALAQRHWKWLLAGAATLQLAVTAGRYLEALAPNSITAHTLARLTPSWFFPGLCFWFAWGIVAGTNVKPFQSWLGGVHRIALLALPVTFIAGIIEWEAIAVAASSAQTSQFRTLADDLFSAAVIIAFLGGGALAPRAASALQSLGVRSFGIYLAHTLGILVAIKLIYRLAPALLPHQLILQPILIAAALALPLGLMWLVDQSPFRRYYKALFG